jgi:hypothetical protein
MLSILFIIIGANAFFDTFKTECYEDGIEPLENHCTDEEKRCSLELKVEDVYRIKKTDGKKISFDWSIHKLDVCATKKKCRSTLNFGRRWSPIEKDSTWESMYPEGTKAEWKLNCSGMTDIVYFTVLFGAPSMFPLICIMCCYCCVKCEKNKH